MSDKDIVKILRKIEGTSLPISVWKHHMLRAASEIEQSRIDLQEYCREVVALTAERDRLKAALETIAEGRDSGRHDGLPADVMHYIACEALEGRSTLLTIRGWERLGSEKVSTHGTPELDEDARKLEAMGQDPGATLEELLAPDTDLLREDAHERKRIESEYPWKE